MKRRDALGLLSVGLTLPLAAGCSGGRANADTGVEENRSTGADGLTIGVAMPTRVSERWLADGSNVKAGLEEAGYAVDLQFGDDDIPTQARQIDAMIEGGCKVLIVGAIDGSALGSQLSSAAAAGVKVISYDRLLLNSADVDHYVSFDNYQVGVDQGTSLLTGLGLLNPDGSPGTATGPSCVELFAGSLDDNNAFFFWKGAWDTIEPFVSTGQVVVRSGQTTIDKTATLRWDGETARGRTEELLLRWYDTVHLDGVLSPYDGISRGIIAALQEAGYGERGKPMAIVTGQDSEIASVKLIEDGVQYSTIFKDTRLLADEAVRAATAIISGQAPEANDTTTYDNGTEVVPAFLLPPRTVTKADITSVLVDSGYYTREDVQRGSTD